MLFFHPQARQLELGAHPTALPAAELLATTACDLAGEGDLVICMGAGSITSWATALPAEIEFLTNGPTVDAAAGGKPRRKGNGQ